MNHCTNHLPIGVFDSGVGGLTVLKALRAELPAEDIIYLGDTARLPYGTKSPETVTRYASQVAKKLIGRHIKLLVVACNTASSVALEDLQQAFAPLPVIGVVEPGAQAACRASKTGHIAIIGTESTILRGAYQQAIHTINPLACTIAKPCPLFVSLAEEGWLKGEIVERIAARYLNPIFHNNGCSRPDCLVLGCTHFPLLASAITHVIGPDVTLVDSANTTAHTVRETLAARSLFTAPASSGHTQFLATDSPTRFARVGTIFLEETIRPEDVEIVDL